MKPKPRLGQHFLTESRAIERIVLRQRDVNACRDHAVDLLQRVFEFLRQRIQIARAFLERRPPGWRSS